jgi:hypothetical protein
MIAVSSALVAALAHLQTQGPGHSITVPASAWEKSGDSIEVWCLRHGLTHEQDARGVRLEISKELGNSGPKGIDKGKHPDLSNANSA